MKRKLMYLFLIAFCITSFTGCNSDDSSEQSTSSPAITPNYSEYLDRAEDVSDSAREAAQESEANQAEINK